MTEREAEQLRKEYYQLCNNELYVGTSIKDIKNRLSGIHPTEAVQTIRCLLDLIQEQAKKHNGIVGASATFAQKGTVMKTFFLILLDETVPFCPKTGLWNQITNVKR